MLPKKSLQICWQTGVLIIAVFVGACIAREVSVTPSSNSVPTSTQTSKTNTPVLTQTLKATPTVTITATIDMITALASEFDIPAACLFSDTYLVSRDQNWIGTDCNVFKELIINRKGAKNKTVIPYQDILDKDSNVFTVTPLSWSSDNRYFYFTTSTVCCSAYNRYEGNGALYQYDAEKNNWGVLINAEYEGSEQPYYFFSEDGERYVYVNQFYEFNMEIGMVEILTKKTKRVTLKGFVIDSPEYAWSSNMDKFAIVLWELQFRDGMPGNVLLKIDFKKMDMELVEEFNRADLLGEE